MSADRSTIPERRREAGFTLLELLISMTILSLLLVILMAIVDSSTKLWRVSENRVDSFREARAALNVIAADLRGALATGNENFFQINTSTNLPSTALSPPEAGNLFFLTRMPADAQSPESNDSDVCAVGYFLAYDSVVFGSGERTMNLYRFFENSNETFKLIEDDKKLPDRPLTTGPSGEEVLARNIVKFEVSAFVYSDSGTLEKFVPSPETPFPDVLEISLVALNNEIAQRLKSESDWRQTSSTMYARNARTFTTRVSLVSPETIPTPTPQIPPSQ